MDFLADYLPFAAKALTVVLLLAAPLALVIVARGRAATHQEETRLVVRKLNERHEDARLSLEAAMLPPREFKARVKQVTKARKGAPAAARRLYVCNFHGDMRATGVSSLREEISAILSVANDADEVAIVLESAGGTLHGYGLAASQLERVRARGLRLTVLVDKVAASGGYMMACVADSIVAAPFAIIGSIGVVAQLPNFNRLLRRHDIDFELVTAGRHKRTLTLFGENTSEGRAKFQAELDEAHRLFKAFITQHRPGLDIEQVATGEYWLATRARELGLIDALATSDAFLIERMAEFDVLEIRSERRRGLAARLLGPLESRLARALEQT